VTAAPAETAPSTHFAEIPAKHLTPHPKNVRVDVGDVTDLAASIKTQGVLQPLVVAPMAPAKGSRSKQQQYVVIAGHRRLAAATTARLTVLPCVVREDLVEEAAQLQAMLVENGQRTDLSPVEEGDAYRALTIDYGVPVKDLAKNIGRSQQLVRGRISLAGSPESVRTRVISGQVPIEQAIELASFEDDPQAHDRLAETLGMSSWSYTVASARQYREAAKIFAREHRELEKAGTRVLDGDQEPDADAVVPLYDLAESASEHAFTAVVDAQHEDVPEDEAERAGQTAAEEARAAFLPDAHGACPGHCAWIHPARFGYSWSAPRIELYCDQPSLHDDATGLRTTSADERDAAEQERLAKAREDERVREERRAALCLAADLRREHLAALAARTTEDTAKALLADGAAAAVRHGTRGADALAQVLGITLQPVPDVVGWDEPEDVRAANREARNAAHDERAEVLAAELRTRPLLELVGLLQVAQWCSSDEAALVDDHWAWQRAKPYLRALAASDYTWSPVEEQLLPEGVAADSASAS